MADGPPGFSGGTPHPLTRRALLAAAAGAGAALTAGCSQVEPGIDRLRELVRGESASSPPAQPAPADPRDPDVRLAVEVMLLCDSAASALRAWTQASDRRPARLRRIAESAAEMHDLHSGLVAGAVPAEAAPGSGRLAPRLFAAAQEPEGALKSAVTIEELAGAGLREAALAARSGPFASLLASMVAASAQQSAQLRAGAGSRR